MSARIYVEGGGDSKDGRIRCREGFRRLLEKTGFKDRMPRLKACGGRGEAYDDFRIAHEKSSAGDYIGLLVDSEDPVSNIHAPWQHFQWRAEDGWAKPPNARDDQVLLMTTCMETWIISDRSALRKHFGPYLETSALPSVQALEQRERSAMLAALKNATRHCPGTLQQRAQVVRSIGQARPQRAGGESPQLQKSVPNTRYAVVSRCSIVTSTTRWRRRRCGCSGSRFPVEDETLQGDPGHDLIRGSRCVGGRRNAPAPPPSVRPPPRDAGRDDGSPSSGVP